MNKETTGIMDGIKKALPFEEAYGIWGGIMELQNAAWRDGMEQGKHDELLKLVADVVPHCAACFECWKRGVKYTINFQLINPPHAG